MWMKVRKPDLSTKMSISKSDMGRGNGLSKSDRVASIEELKEKEKGIITMTPQQDDNINKPEPIILNAK
jgi:hypothetical protein